MRLWHQSLIKRLPRQQLLGQHRECCALRGNGWGRKHSTVDYVFQHSFARLVSYHELVMAEMTRRGYRVDQRWTVPEYRGKNCLPVIALFSGSHDTPIYPEHDAAYLDECLQNLRRKGIRLPQ